MMRFWAYEHLVCFALIRSVLFGFEGLVEPRIPVPPYFGRLFLVFIFQKLKSSSFKRRSVPILIFFPKWGQFWFQLSYGQFLFLNMQ